MWKLCLSTKFPHQEITPNYSIFRSDLLALSRILLLQTESDPILRALKFQNLQNNFHNSNIKEFFTKMFPYTRNHYILKIYFLDQDDGCFYTETTKCFGLPKTKGLILVINVKIDSTENYRVSVV